MTDEGIKVVHVRLKSEHYEVIKSNAVEIGSPVSTYMKTIVLSHIKNDKKYK